MTKWIDDMAAGLSDDQKRKNFEHARQLHDARVIASQGPAFMDELLAATKDLVNELTEKVGATAYLRYDSDVHHGFKVTKMPEPEVFLECQPTLVAHMLQVAEGRTDAEGVPQPSQERLIELAVNDQGHIVAIDGDRRLDDAAALASWLLERALAGTIG